jgi:hypothetical protein
VTIDLSMLMALFARPELHWYEAAGIGPKEFKVKHLL